MSNLGYWLQAARIPSQLYIFVPLYVGQILAKGSFSHVDLSVFVLIHAFGLFDQLFIVFSNDYYDQKTDAINKNANLFTGGSRVAPEGKITGKDLIAAARVMAILCILIALIFSVFYDQHLMLPFVLLGLFLMVLYSFPPFQFSYRGGGEILQAIGVGLLLPMIGYYGQSAEVSSFPWESYLVFFPTQLACALSTTIPDRYSDAKSHKRTFSVQLGLGKVRAVIALLQLISFFFLHTYFQVSRHWSFVLLGILFLQAFLFMGRFSDRSKEVIFVGLSIVVTTFTMLLVL